MINPIEAYLLHAKRLTVPVDVMDSHVDYMKKAMFYPPVQDEDCRYATHLATKLTEMEVFAHGSDIIRLAKAVPFAQHDSRHDWLVQSMSLRDNSFVTQKIYPFDANDPQASQLAYNDAYKDAREWYPAPDKQSHIKKWSGLSEVTELPVPPQLDSREKLAEFWYESKAIDWDDDERPFPCEFDIAQYLLSSRATLQDPSWSDKYFEKIETYAWNMRETWGVDEIKTVLLVENSRPIVIDNYHDEKLSTAHHGHAEFHINKNIMVCEITDARTREKTLSTALLPIDFPNIVDVRGIDDSDIARIYKALQVSSEPIFNAPKDENYLSNDGTKIITYSDGTEGFFSVYSGGYSISFEDKAYDCDHKIIINDNKPAGRQINFDNEYRITVYSEKFTGTDYEIGADGQREEIISGEIYLSDELNSLVTKFGSFVPSDSSPSDDGYVYFKTVSPSEDREHFEKDVDTFFQLHVLEINGTVPTASGLQRFADAMQITFREPIALPQSDFAFATPGKHAANSIDNTF